MLKLFAVLCFLLTGSVQAQFPVGGTFTDSQTVVSVPAAPAGMTQAVIKLEARSRYFAGWETGLTIFEGVGGCDWTSVGSIRQHITVKTNGMELVGGRTRLDFNEGGPCVPFDGVYDWMGSSGGSTGQVWKYLTMSATVPINLLGPTITVGADGSSVYDQTITCWGIPPYLVEGKLHWLNESWWDGTLTVTYIP